MNRETKRKRYGREMKQKKIKKTNTFLFLLVYLFLYLFIYLFINLIDNFFQVTTKGNKTGKKTVRGFKKQQKEK